MGEVHRNSPLSLRERGRVRGCMKKISLYRWEDLTPPPLLREAWVNLTPARKTLHSRNLPQGARNVPWRVLFVARVRRNELAPFTGKII